MERRNTEMTLTLRLFLLFNESLDFSAEIANLALFFGPTAHADGKSRKRLHTVEPNCAPGP